MSIPVKTGSVQQVVMPTMALEPRMYTPMEAAKLLNIGRTKMYELINGKDIQSIRIGRSIRIPAECIQSYVERQLQNCYNDNENPPCCEKGA